MKARRRVLDAHDSTPTIRTNLPWAFTGDAEDSGCESAAGDCESAGNESEAASSDSEAASSDSKSAGSE